VTFLPIAQTRLNMWLTLSRNVTLQLNQPNHASGIEAIPVSQSISGLTAGDFYYFTAQVNRLGYDGFCVFDISTNTEGLVSRIYFNDQETSCEAFHASGVSESANTKITLLYYCYNEGAKDPIDIWAAVDNVALFAYRASETPSCPANDKHTYTNKDGSQFMIVCGQDYAGNNIVGINPVVAADFSSCIDYCMYQGTACVGVSWIGDSSECYLKNTMSPSPDPRYVVYSAIRVTGPMLGPLPSQLIANGDFATGLSSWNTSQKTQQGDSFAWNNGRA
jgi:hypothetical protein